MAGAEFSILTEQQHAPTKYIPTSAFHSWEDSELTSAGDPLLDPPSKAATRICTEKTPRRQQRHDHAFGELKRSLDRHIG